MKKGLKIALAAHCVGVCFAMVLAWFVPLLLPMSGIDSSVVRPMQITLLIVGLAWSIWKGREIVDGKDQFANKYNNTYREKHESKDAE